MVLFAWSLFKLKTHVSVSLSSACLRSHYTPSPGGQYSPALCWEPLPCGRASPAHYPSAKAPLLDKLSGLRHGSFLFTNCDIFHLKQISAQKRIVLGLNGLSDINGAVSDSGQESHPKSERSLCSVQKDTKREKGMGTCVRCLTFLVWRRIGRYFLKNRGCWCLHHSPLPLICCTDALLIGLGSSGPDSVNKDLL